jgi:hypothetical protein
MKILSTLMQTVVNYQLEIGDKVYYYKEYLDDAGKVIEDELFDDGGTITDEDLIDEVRTFLANGFEC